MKSLQILPGEECKVLYGTEIMNKVIEAVNSCYRELMFEIRGPCSPGLGHILRGATRDQLVTRVSKCNRVVARTKISKNGPIAEMDFCMGEEVVDILTIVYHVRYKQLFTKSSLQSTSESAFCNSMMGL